METFWTVFGAAFGYGIGGSILQRMQGKYGPVPWWYNAFFAVVGAAVIWLGYRALTQQYPFS